MYTINNQEMISEIKCGNNFIYIIESMDCFAATDYKVLQNHMNNLFVRCMKILHNGKRGLYYVSEDYRSFAAMREGVTSDSLLTIIINLFRCVMEVRNNGFLYCHNIDISWDKIFVEPQTFKVRLVYLPIVQKRFNSYIEFESELRLKLIEFINNTTVLIDDRIKRLISDLANATLSLAEICKMNDINYEIGKPNFSSETRNDEIKEKYIKLVALNAPTNFEIIIDKDEVIIGKIPELSDAIIPFNKMISRKHCKICRQEGKYFISDEKSANGTYVNRIRVAPGQLYPIKKGDMIRLADSDFQVV